MNSKKAIIAWIFSAIVGIGMLVMPTRALAHDWDQDDDGWHNGWYNHQGEDEEEDEQENEDYQRPAYGYGYHQEPDADDYYQPGYGSNWNQALNGWANPRHPGLVWVCNSQGHHCRWAQRYGYRAPLYGLNPGYRGYDSSYPYSGQYYGNNQYYGNSQYYGSNRGGLGALIGPLLGIPIQ